ncbi:MAG: hypothetical protein IJM13_06905 [Lachnospiraceae bacterium]|nr:hypothetical protein [Lachnospiraceae bacterium]MBQ1399063.1 hypothetical protein [Lachnospiraceae bacterium]MBQ1414933.1 hypothetical protein [Lachnospiraceae bacterium]MBQ1514859.1 hypothetical protein [Lachnospiraceae bacterium]MBQ3401363.1 hypothetical protein [Lachnospiraceae bacterium]
MPAALVTVTPAFWVIIIILAAVVAVLLILVFIGKRAQKRQAQNEDIIRANAQVVSVLVIDKKKMKITQAGLPDLALAEVKWYQKIQKIPVVKVKVQNRIANVLCDVRVYDALPVKCEAKVVLSGLYITEIRSIRGGAILQPEKKKTLWQRFTGIFTKKK